MCYDLYYGNKLVGRVEADRKGMCYIIRCRAKVESAGRFRLQASSNGGHILLGLCVPYGSGFGTECRIAANKFNCENVTFSLVNESDVKYETVMSNHPFQYLSRLTSAKFVNMKDSAGILIDTEGDYSI